MDYANDFFLLVFLGSFFVWILIVIATSYKRAKRLGKVSKQGPEYELWGKNWRSFLGALKDSSTITLLLSNLAVIALALQLNWSFLMMLWVYWLQSVIIGFFVFLKSGILIVRARHEITIEAPTQREADLLRPAGVFFVLFLILFFPLHYGLFHLAYALLLSGMPGAFNQPQLSGMEFQQILIGGAIFFAGSLSSFTYHKEWSVALAKQKAKRKEKDNLIMSTYFRIFPMHLAILWAVSSGGGAFLPFLAIKTLADMATHVLQLTKLSYEPQWLEPKEKPFPKG